MEARQAMYQFVTGLINLVWVLWPFVGPFVLMGVIIKIVRWGYSSARGERDFDDLQNEGQDNLAQLRKFRTDTNEFKQYRQLRRAGFTPWQIGHYRNQAPGKRFRR